MNPADRLSWSEFKSIYKSHGFSFYKALICEIQAKNHEEKQKKILNALKRTEHKVEDGFPKKLMVYEGKYDPSTFKILTPEIKIYEPVYQDILTTKR